MLVTTIAATILSLGSVVSALDYRGYSSTNGCSGSSFGCSDGGAVCCGPLPAAYGYSAQFDNLPAGSQGQGYTNRCSAFLFALYGPGTQCWRGGGARATYLNWFHSASRKRSSDTPCTPPNSFEYKDAEGQPRTIKVPDVTSAEIIAEHYSNGNFTALAEYEIHT